MPTSSLLSVARLLQATSLKGMAASVGLPLPTTARQIIARASFTLLPGWELVTRNGIAKDEVNDVWHTGHLEDVLSIDGNRLLLANHTGGVWLAAAGGQFDPIPLSDGWRKPDIHSLSAGPKGPRHYYAVGEEGALFETETESLLSVARFMQSKSVRQMAARLGLAPPISVRELMRRSDAPLFDWHAASVLKPDGTPLTDAIRKILIMPGLQPPKLVLGTNSAIFWADIPALGHDYRLDIPVGIPQGHCLGLASGPENRVLATPTGGPDRADTNGAYFGTWLFGKLIMRLANHLGDIDFRQWQYAVVASCASNPSVCYAAVSASGSATRSLQRAFAAAGITTRPKSSLQLAQQSGMGKPISLAALINKLDPPTAHDHLYAVLGSTDGGATWAPVGPDRQVAGSVRLPRDPGSTQEGYNISIAVSHADPNLIALGWRIGPWVGRNTPTGFTWEEHGDDGATPGAQNPHIHSDSHGMIFDPHDSSGSTCFMCSDGGLVSTTDLFKTFASSVNRLLPNLQFQSYPPRQSNGAAGASGKSPGLVVGPLQDNGVVFSFRNDSGPRPWQRLTVADDGLVAILLRDDVIVFWNNDNPVARVRQWNGSQWGGESNLVVKAPSPTVPAGATLSGPFVEPIPHPSFRRPGDNQSMVAIGAFDPAGGFRDLWGIFADDGGGNPGWDFIATVGLGPQDSITAAGSDDGRTVLVGSASGLIFSCDAASGRVTPMGIATGQQPAGPVYQFAFLGDGTAFARYASELLRLTPGQASWTAFEGDGLPAVQQEGSRYFAAVDTGRQPNVLYVGTDYGIHASWDAGANWLPVSQGLAVRSHPSTLRFTVEPDGSRHLTLTTFGRSAWRTQLN
jgi:hypothetical protein